MSVFTLRIKNGDEEISQCESPSYAAARNDALRTFGRMIADVRRLHGPEWKQLTLSIVDKTGLTLLSLEFSATESAAIRRSPAVD